LHEKGWRNQKHREQFLSSLTTYAFPIIGKMRPADIDNAAVLRVLEPIWTDVTVTADRVRTRIEQILDWCTHRKHRTGDNPARWKGNLKHELSRVSKIHTVEHHPALPYKQIGEFFVQLHSRDGIAAMALEFTILTAARTGETIGARWNEIDWDEQAWTVPANRIKGGMPHRVPLVPRAIEILKACHREDDNPYVFIGLRDRGSGLSKMAMAHLLGRMGHDDITVHGFRGTFRTWAGDKTMHQREVIEKALAHKVGDETERAYDLGELFEKRRALMNEWSSYCLSPPRDAAKVIPMMQGRP
jgi:integrase